jgi:hypothetical protein
MGLVDVLLADMSFNIFDPLLPPKIMDIYFLRDHLPGQKFDGHFFLRDHLPEQKFNRHFF